MQKHLAKDRFKNKEIENRDDELGKKSKWARASRLLPGMRVTSFS